MPLPHPNKSLMHSMGYDVHAADENSNQHITREVNALSIMCQQLPWTTSAANKFWWRLQFVSTAEYCSQPSLSALFKQCCCHVGMFARAECSLWSTSINTTAARPHPYINQAKFKKLIKQEIWKDRNKKFILLLRSFFCLLFYIKKVHSTKAPKQRRSKTSKCIPLNCCSGHLWARSPFWKNWRISPWISVSFPMFSCYMPGRHTFSIWSISSSKSMSNSLSASSRTKCLSFTKPNPCRWQHAPVTTHTNLECSIRHLKGSNQSWYNCTDRVTNSAIHGRALSH